MYSGIITDAARAFPEAAVPSAEGYYDDMISLCDSIYRGEPPWKIDRRSGLYGKSDREIGDLFGTVDDKAARSKISFTESEVTDGSWKKPWKKITRNSIDRYTGGTIDGALFTELTHYGGETTLTIDIDEPKA